MTDVTAALFGPVLPLLLLITDLLTLLLLDAAVAATEAVEAAVVSVTAVSVPETAEVEPWWLGGLLDGLVAPGPGSGVSDPYGGPGRLESGCGGCWLEPP